MLEGSASSMDSGDGDYILTHGEIGARYHFANPARRWIPYLDAGVGGRTATQEDVEVCTPTCARPVTLLFPARRSHWAAA